MLRGLEWGKVQRSFIFWVPIMAREVNITSIRELGDTLRQVRKESGLTQRDAAALCNVSLPFLNALERGKTTAQIGKVLAVCQRFGIEVRLTLPMPLNTRAGTSGLSNEQSRQQRSSAVRFL